MRQGDSGWREGHGLLSNRSSSAGRGMPARPARGSHRRHEHVHLRRLERADDRRPELDGVPPTGIDTNAGATLALGGSVLSTGDRADSRRLRRRRSRRGEPAQNRLHLRRDPARTGTLTSVIELLYWDGCPSHPEALEVLRAALAAAGRDDAIVQREITTQAEAEAAGFPGSPTILVDGRDVDPACALLTPAALSCRIYRLPDGRPSPVPSRQQIEEALAP